MTKPQFLFVYNADSGLFNTITDWAHKMVSPVTYQCGLCALTYGNFTMKNEWKKFLQHLPAEVSFTYKNDFVKEYQQAAELPAVFLKKENILTLFITKKEIENCASTEALQQLVLSKLSMYDQHHHSYL